MKNCYFCNKERILYENETFYSRPDFYPASPKHTLVVIKKHEASLLNLNKKEWLDMQDAITKTIKILEKTNFKKIYEELKKVTDDKNQKFLERSLNKNLTQKPKGYNIGVNEGEHAGRTVHHLHIHIIPRYEGDVKNPRGGIRNIMPGVGDYTN